MSDKTPFDYFMKIKIFLSARYRRFRHRRRMGVMSIGDAVFVLPILLVLFGAMIVSPAQERFRVFEYREGIRIQRNNLAVAQRQLAESVEFTSTISIRGHERFIRRTQAALNLIRRLSPADYDFVAQYLSVITWSPLSNFVHVWPIPTFYACTWVYNRDIALYASDIFHEAVHSRQMREVLRGIDAFIEDAAHLRQWDELIELLGRETVALAVFLAMESRFYIEQEALEEQIAFLHRIQACRIIIEHAEGWRGQVW